MNPGYLVTLATVSLIVPGLVAWLAARRMGLGILWAALIAGAILGLAGWFITREPLLGDAEIRRSVAIYFVLLPGFVGMVLGAGAGAVADKFRLDR
ncbi:MAG: hypothetical protein Q4G22_00700 [Paracoccus sp. (in: a-proteobacteria)]|uniref:hypothetical protein n=1 Tax=Paracoccus sp. TaxID=267 RepID=UPI0026E0A56E|nr:hypothetical protein [Paracoccus sp. (in: a-proteobacteria)]MDO5630335.1 hypothetical protein [Paracoccus sp. (in: a-proteobacteria)]